MYFELFRRRDVSVDLERRRIVVKRRLRHEAIDYAGFEDEAIRRAAVLEVADFVAFLNPLPRQCLDHTRGNLRHADEYTADLTDRGILAVDDDHRTGDNRGGVTLRIVQPARVDALRFFRDATGDQLASVLSSQSALRSSSSIAQRHFCPGCGSVTFMDYAGSDELD